MGSPIVKVGLDGLYKAQVMRADGSVKQDTGWFGNLILDSGLDMLGFSPSQLNYSSYASKQYLRACCVGTGSSAPVTSQVSLDATVATDVMSNSDFGHGINGTDNYSWFRCQYEFSPGQATGNISEVGVGRNSGELFSRSLIKDQFGNPTTLTILSDEYLRVFYELRLYQPTEDTVATVDGHTVTVRAANINSSNSWGGGYTTSTSNYLDSHGRTLSMIFGDRIKRYYTDSTVYYSGNATLGPVTGSPSAASSSADSSSEDYTTAHAYVSGNYYRDYTITLPPSAVNLPGGIGAIRCSTPPICEFQMLFDPPIPKTSLDKAQITIRFSWGRYTPPV